MLKSSLGSVAQDRRWRARVGPAQQVSRLVHMVLDGPGPDIGNSGQAGEFERVEMFGLGLQRVLWRAGFGDRQSLAVPVRWDESEIFRVAAGQLVGGRAGRRRVARALPRSPTGQGVFRRRPGQLPVQRMSG